MPPLVTVLTCTFNASRYIAETIESIQAQTFDDWEYLIVDDASTDTTLEIVDRFAKEDPRIRVVRRHENGGPYVAANQGFDEAAGRYVARLDADDVCVPHRLETQIAFLRQNPNLRACAAEVLMLDRSGARPMGGTYPALPGALKWRFFFRIYMPSTTFMEKGAWRDVGGFKELPLSQDLRMWCDLSRRHWLGAVSEPLVYWRVHDEQLSSTRFELQQQLATDAMKDHIRELTGESWTDEDIGRLRSIGIRALRLREGLDVIRRWEAMWRADDSLSVAERRELVALTRRLRRQHARTIVRAEFAARATGRALLRIRSELKRRVRH